MSKSKKTFNCKVCKKLTVVQRANYKRKTHKDVCEYCTVDYCKSLLIESKKNVPGHFRAILNLKTKEIEGMEIPPGRIYSMNSLISWMKTPTW